MVPTLIVLGLLALGVGIVAFATRRSATRQDVIVDNDTAWGNPMTAAAEPTSADPFAHAPLPTATTVAEPPRTDPIHLERAS